MSNNQKLRKGMRVRKMINGDGKGIPLLAKAVIVQNPDPFGLMMVQLEGPGIFPYERGAMWHAQETEWEYIGMFKYGG